MHVLHEQQQKNYSLSTFCSTRQHAVFVRQRARMFRAFSAFHFVNNTLKFHAITRTQLLRGRGENLSCTGLFSRVVTQKCLCLPQDWMNVVCSVCEESWLCNLLRTSYYKCEFICETIPISGHVPNKLNAKSATTVFVRICVWENCRHFCPLYCNPVWKSLVNIESIWNIINYQYNNQ